MALIDKASLLFVPSVVAEGKAFNILPSGNRAPDSTNQNSGYDQTRADFDFDRGSNAAATRVNASGLIEKYRENLLLQSNNFDTTWILNAATITGGQSGYDGNNNAWKLQDTAVTGEHFVRQTPSVGNIVSFSVYAKANTLNFLWLRSVEGGVNKRTWFDLSSGSVGTSQGIDATIEPVGTDGWYRCSATFNHQAAFEYYIAISDANGSSSYTGDGTGSIFIQNAQLESGLVASSYLESTSVTGKAGVLVDLPRINYDANGENGALLLEPSRQNLVTHSEYFGASNWTTLRSSIALSSVTSPEGKANAYKLTTDGTANNTHIIYYGGTLTSNTYSLSLYAKAAEFSKIGLGTGNLTLSAKFDLSSGSVITSGAHTASIEAAGNDWYRCTIVTTTTTPIRIVLLDNDGNISFDGDGTSGLYIFGHQQEAGSYATSYIPTMGTSETRAADSCLDGGNSDVFDNSNAVWFIDIERIGTDSSVIGDSLTLRDNSNVRQITLWFDAPTKQVRFRDGKNSFTTIGSSGGAISTPDNTRIKIALKIDGTTLKVFADGVQKGSNYTRPTAFDITQMEIEGKGYKIRNIQFYNSTLTDAECETLTTL